MKILMVLFALSLFALPIQSSVFAVSVCFYNQTTIGNDGRSDDYPMTGITSIYMSPNTHTIWGPNRLGSVIRYKTRGCVDYPYSSCWTDIKLNLSDGSSIVQEVDLCAKDFFFVNHNYIF